MTEPNVRSFKLQARERRVRIVPKWDKDGRPFADPGVDLLGADADAALELAAPMVRWLRAREPGLALRSLSVDLAIGRVLVSFDDPHAVSAKPLALRIALPDSSELLDAARPLVAALGERAARALAARRH